MKNQSLTNLERTLLREYNLKAKEVTAGVLDRTKSYDMAYKDFQKKIKDGILTSDEFTAWLRMQLNSIWSRDVAEFVNGELIGLTDLTNKLIREERKTAFIYGYNTGLYHIEKELQVKTVFNLLDEHTMERLLFNNPKLLPPSKKYPWGSRRVHAALVQSMLKGESAKKLAKRLANTIHMDKVSAIRNARTAVTSCENAGRLEMAREAAEYGIQTEKVWLATLDERTRSSHAEMDGVSIPLDEAFKLTNRDGSTSELMFPGDPDGDPEQVYNCRCTLVYNVNNSLKSVDPAIIDRKSKVGSYDKWKNQHKERQDRRRKART